MAAETRHAGLTADERSDIRSTVLEARELIEDDIYRQLERYGVYEDERVDLDQLGHLDAYDRQTRRAIDAALDRELEATEGDYQRSVENYVREATKTYLNRLVALKAIEVRGLVTETLIQRPEYGNRSEMLRTVDEVLGELTDQQDGGFSVALELAYAELADEISVIFKESEHTVIDIDFAVREDVIDQLNAIDQSVWESDEAIGWVYQYFGERERDEIDERISSENYKVQDTDIATKTQLFTPNYIVEWLVDNSLGRLWMEMNPETEINRGENCNYLTPIKDSLVEREPKDVRDIKILDPACGSGHMLFYAFDVLYEMYLEQGDVPESQIPNEILKNNLYGIDIDPGVSQLSALSLYIKAKTKEPDVEIEQINIVPADAVLINGNKKKEIKEGLSELDKRILDEVWESFENIREYGSLVRIEEKIDKIIDEWSEESGVEFAEGQTRFTDSTGLEGQAALDSIGEQKQWTSVKEEILSVVSNLAEEALEENNPVEEMFTDEVEKSVQLLDLFLYDYDVVVSNPPYLGSGKMDEDLKKFIKNNYYGTRDLYSAFIERCGEFSKEDGYISMVTPESYMFLKSYRDLRTHLMNKYQFIEGMHLGGHGFDIGDRPYTVAFVVRDQDPSNFKSLRFYRMTHKQEEYSNYSSKILGLKEITKANRKGESHKDVYNVNQNDFLGIGNSPFIYWYGQEVLSKFTECDPFDDYIFVQSGIKSGNNDVFLRKNWEVSSDAIGDRYKPLVRSENSLGYFDQTTYLIDWKDNGGYIERYCSEHGHQCFFGDKERLGQECIGFQDMNRKHFVARKIPSGYFCDTQLYPVYPNEELDLDYITGWLNSALVRFIMDGLNPTMHFKQGDIKRLPYTEPESDDGEISELVSDVVSRTKEKSRMKETTLLFSSEYFSSILHQGTVKAGIKEYLLRNEMVASDRAIVQGLVDQKVFDIYNISDNTQDHIYKDLPTDLSKYPHILNAGVLQTDEYEFRSEVSVSEFSQDEYEKLVENIDKRKENSVRVISEELEVSPYTVALVRHRHDIYDQDNEQDAVARLLSYYLGCAMGRWSLDELSSAKDGIIVFDEEFENNLNSYIQSCIKNLYGEDNVYDRENEIESLLNKEIVTWFRDSFFRYHHCKEYRRRGQRNPIYWHIESDEGAFSCFVYYHAIDSDTFPKLRGQYIDRKLDTLQNRLETIDSELNAVNGDRARELRSQKEEIQADIDDITEFRDRVDALIEEGFEPDFEAGIWENIQKVDEHDLLAVPLDKL